MDFDKDGNIKSCFIPPNPNAKPRKVYAIATDLGGVEHYATPLAYFSNGDDGQFWTTNKGFVAWGTLEYTEGFLKAVRAKHKDISGLDTARIIEKEI